MEVKDLFPEVPVNERWDDAVIEVANCCPTCEMHVRANKEGTKRNTFNNADEHCPNCGEEMTMVRPFGPITTRDPYPHSPIWFSSVYRCNSCGSDMFFLPVHCDINGNQDVHYHCVDHVSEATRNQIKDCIRHALAQYAGQVRVVDPMDDSPLVEMNKITETTLNQILSELKEGGLMICERP